MIELYTLNPNTLKIKRAPGNSVRQITAEAQQVRLLVLSLEDVAALQGQCYAALRDGGCSDTPAPGMVAATRTCGDCALRSHCESHAWRDLSADKACRNFKLKEAQKGKS